jgi:endonuclease YncB( thermonuclease family)
VASADTERAQVVTPFEQPPQPAAAALVAAGDGDGDSWHDTDGNEYRLGLINAPEVGECFGSEATAERRAQTSAGFSALSYATDTYGRSVSVVLTVEGVNLNVHLARRGFADDKYLERFRHENPQLAAELDAAFAAAKTDGVGLWSACRSDAAVHETVAAPQRPGSAPATPSGSVGDCHPDYATCVSIRGDGSGSGQANDVDCGGLSGSVRVRAAGVDPYRLDRDGDGIGCD